MNKNTNNLSEKATNLLVDTQLDKQECQTDELEALENQVKNKTNKVLKSSTISAKVFSRPQERTMRRYKR